MPRLFLYALCSILVASDVFQAAAMSDRQRQCPPESYVAAEAELEIGGNATKTVVDFRDDDLGECPCAKKKCLALCCPIGSVATNRAEPGCTAVENATVPEFPRYNDPWASGEHTGQFRIRDFHVFTWNPCPEDEMFELAPGDEFLFGYDYNLLANGSIYLPRGERSVDFTNYCFVAVDNSTVYYILLCGVDNFLDVLPEEHPQLANLFRAADVLSTICSSATFVLYSVLPELRNTHGATVRGYVGTMAVAHIANILMWLMPKQRIGKALCIMLAVIDNFFSLASFFWLNVMCFDIWCTFGRVKTLQSSARHRKKNKLTVYSAYAWGSTAFITVISFFMDMVPDGPRTFISPTFSGGICWYTTMYAHVMYYLLPIAVMGCVNLCFFLSTARKIMQHRKDVASQLNGADSRRHEDNKQEFNIYIKLFIMMGLNRSTDILSWLFAYHPEPFWIILDVFAELQGVIVFVVFVWKGKVRRLLLKRLGYGGDRRSTSSATKAPAPRENNNPDSKRTKSTQEGGSDRVHQTEC